MEMNIYDFDKTIFPRDSTADFYFFMLARNPNFTFSSGQFTTLSVSDKKSIKPPSKKSFMYFLPESEIPKNG